MAPGTDPTYGMSASNTETMYLKATVQSIWRWDIHTPFTNRKHCFLGSKGKGGSGFLPVRRGVGNAGNLNETVRLRHLRLDTCKPKSEEIIWA